MHAWLCFMYNGDMKEYPLLEIYHKEIPAFLREFAQTEAMLRLRDVGMDCALEYTSFPRFQNIPPYHRYEHSVGVGLITWHFTSDIKMSVAALLHDIATPCFSHVVDFLNEDHLSQESTEEDTEKVIRNDEGIMKLLRKYSLSVEEVKDYHIYPIADNDRPQLSADRLEYTLTNLYRYEGCTLEEIEAIYGDITVSGNKNELIFQSADTALKFAEKALDTCKIYVADADRYTMEYLAQLLKRAIGKGVITRSDLDQTEGELLRKLVLDEECRELWEHLTKLKTMILPERKLNEFTYRVDAKKRYMDPYVEHTGRISGIDEAFRKDLRDFLDKDLNYWIYAEVEKDV